MYKTSPKVAIIGAGISGLTLGYKLSQKEIPYTIFESSDRFGGYIGTIEENGFLVEIGANGFLDNEPETLNLIEELSLKDQVLYSNLESKNRYLITPDGLQLMPSNPKAFLFSSFFSLSEKLKVLSEPLRAKRLKTSSDESVYSFFQRHFGDTFTQKIAQAFVTGIYAGDAKSLSLAACFPKIKDMESIHGSLIKSQIKSKKKAPQLFSFKNGNQTLLNALYEKCKQNILYKTKVDHLEREQNFWTLKNSDNKNLGSSIFSHIIITTPPAISAKLLSGILTQENSNQLSQVDCVPVSSISLGFDKEIPFNGFGALKQNNNIDIHCKGFLKPSCIFNNRAPDNSSLFTFLIENKNNNSERIINYALEDFQKLFKTSIKPQKIWHWKHNPGIPQYSVGTNKFWDKLDQNLSNTNIHIASNWYRGVSLNDCIKKAVSIIPHLQT